MAMSDTFGMPQKRRRKEPTYSQKLPKRLAKKRAASDSDFLDVELSPDSDNLPWIEDGTLHTRMPDGSIIMMEMGVGRRPAAKLEHDANLAEHMEESELDLISAEVLEGIADDDMSRQEWLAQRTKGIDLLGFKIKPPRSGGANSGAVEGQSSIDHSLLAEAVLRGKANARGELLPASGPVKVRIDGDDESESLDVLAQRLKQDMNHYLTTVATEYYDDTDRMLFWVFFGGSAFKKVYWCPLRRRPVSESVDAKDFIVSNNATDIDNAARRTHVISMRPSVMKRMQILDVYRDVPLEDTTLSQPDPVTQKIDDVQGIQKPSRPQDNDYELYECYCELDLKGFEHKYEKGKRNGKSSGLALPYRVTIEKNSRKILEIRRNWEEGDTDYTAKNPFVHYMFDTAIGLYGLGLVSILGNTTNALTAAWREVIDAGMFACFPGFMYAKNAGTRNQSNQFRVAPGSGVAIETGGLPIQNVVMPLPYKEASAGFVSFIDGMAATGARLGGTSEAMVGEGNSEAKTGSTLAMIEQASKMMSAVHKRLHSAQAREFQKLRDEFRKDPSALWRNNKKASKFWNVEIAKAALEEYSLVPVADPNEPTELHRILKSQAVTSLAGSRPPGMYDMKKVDAYAMRLMGVPNPEKFFAPDQPAAPDPKVVAKMEEIKVKQGELGLKGKDLELKAVLGATDASIKREQMAADQTVEALRTVQRVSTNPDSDHITDENLAQMAPFLHPIDLSRPPAPVQPPMPPPAPMPPMMPPMPPQQGMLP